MSQLTRFNPILLERLTSWQHAASNGTGVDSSDAAEQCCTIPEWGGVCYQLQRCGNDRVRLSLSMPSQHKDKDLEQIQEAVKAAYASCATLLDSQPGCLVTLEVNTKKLARLPSSLREYFLKELASLRLTVEGRTLRQHFQRLAAGTCSPGCPDPQHSGRQLYFIQPLQDAVRITFAMRFSAHDAAIGAALLQEFAVARKRAALGKAPECCYHEASEPPEDLDEFQDMLQDVNGGFVSFTFLRRHVDGPQMAAVMWNVCSFGFVISRALTASKASLHAHMRLGLVALKSQLDAQRPPWQAQQAVV